MENNELNEELIDHALQSVSVPDRDAMPTYPPDSDDKLNLDNNFVLPIVANTPKAHNAEASSNYKYKLYDIDYNEITINDWNNETNDQSSSTKYWESYLSFQPSNFVRNATSSDHIQIRNLWETIFFAVSLLLIFILFCLYSSKIKNSELANESSSISKAMAVTFFLSLIFLGIILILLIFIPSYFIDYGIWISLLVSLLMTVVAILCKSYSSIGYVIFIYFLGLTYYYMSRFGFSFGKDILKYIKPIFIQQWTIFVGYILFITILSILFGYLVFGASAAKANGFLHFFVLVLYWFTIVVFGNVVYQITAYITSMQYFADSPENVSPTKLVLPATKRAILYNFGISVHNALLLPFTEPIRLIAITDPAEIKWKLNEINDSLLKIITKVFDKIHIGAVKAMQKIDEYFNYPNKCGMIYSAIFLIPVSEGNRRVAEVNSKKYIHLIRKSCVVEALYSCHALIYAIVSGFMLIGVVHMTAVKCTVCYIAAGYGFFFTFAVFYLVRSHIGGIIDTSIYCFNELPLKLEDSDSAFMRALTNIFDNALLRKRELYSRNSNESVEKA